MGLPDCCKALVIFGYLCPQGIVLQLFGKFDHENEREKATKDAFWFKSPFISFIVLTTEKVFVASMAL